MAALQVGSTGNSSVEALGSSELKYVPKPSPPVPSVTFAEFLELLKHAVAEDIPVVPRDQCKQLNFIVDAVPRLLTDTNWIRASSHAKLIKRAYPGALAELEMIREQRRDGRLPSVRRAEAVDLETVAVEWAEAGGWR